MKDIFIFRIFFTSHNSDENWLLYIRLISLPNLSARAECDLRSVFKRVLTSLNSDFSFSHTGYLTKVNDPSLFYYLPIAGGWILGFMPLPRALVWSEIRIASSRIWTRVIVSIISWTPPIFVCFVYHIKSNNIQIKKKYCIYIYIYIYMAERYDPKCNVKLGGFRCQLLESYVSSHTEELGYNKTACRWMTIYIYIYIYIYNHMIVCVCVCMNKWEVSF